MSFCLEENPKKLNELDGCYFSRSFRYTSKGATVYAIITAKPPTTTLKLLIPQTSATTKVNGIIKITCCHLEQVHDQTHDQ